MRKPDWSQFRAGWGIIVLAGALKAWPMSYFDDLRQIASLLLGVAGLLLLATSLRPTLRSLAVVERWQRWRVARDQAKQYRQTEAERQREAKREAERRAEWWEACRAWDEFSYDAGQLVAAMDGFRFDHEPSNWQTIMVIKARLALLLSQSLHPRHRSTADRLIRPFENIRPDAASANHLAGYTHELREFLQSASVCYVQKGDAIGFRPYLRLRS